MKPVVDLILKIKKILATRWFPWLLLALLVLIFSLNEIINKTLFRPQTLNGQIFFWTSVLGLTGIFSLILYRMSDLYDQREKLRSHVQQVEDIIRESDKRLEAIFKVSQKFAEASDENEVIEPVLRLLNELIGARGAAFVPLDEHGQPQSAISRGEMQRPVMNAWLEYLASPKIRERCSTCDSFESLETRQSCSLLKGPFAEEKNLYCLPVRRGDNEYGVVTIALSDPVILDNRTRSFLRALIDETALGLESIRLRRREISALREMQVLREKTDLKGMLYSLLDNIVRTLEVEFAVMLIRKPYLIVPKGTSEKTLLKIGEIPEPALPFIDGLMQGVISSKEPFILGEGGGDPTSSHDPLSLVAVPLSIPDQEPLGVILVGNRKTRRLNKRQLSLLQTIAGQVSLVAQNARLMAELEYKTLMDERTRLAREIHDGLAQTLGLLKLQVAQMRNNLNRGEIERVLSTMEVCYTTLNEAYHDARQTIDGLRISPVESGIHGWLEQILQDFREVTNLKIEIQDRDLHSEIPAEIHVQLIRIVQEALSNIRKHAQASQVWVECFESEGEIIFEIRDDGIGFSPEDISQPSRHGLRGMYERANLIDAEIRVISRPQEGTIIRVVIPIRQMKEFAP